MYIAIAGNIGSGKTTLTELLSAHYAATAYFEEPNNPYIGDFYEDMNRWSFNLQAYFLASRIEQTQAILKGSDQQKSHIFQDRTIYEDAHIFARNLMDMGLMTQRDFATYMKTFSLFESYIPRPDLLIYLRASVPKLKEQITKRGREYEMSIEEEYLKRLDAHYRRWIESYEGRVLEIDVDKEDFEHNSADFERICAYINNLEREKR